MITGGVVAATGGLVTAVGVPLWATGTTEPAPNVTVGPGTIDVRGRF